MNIIRLKNEIEEVFYKCKYGFQRMFRGYDDVDVFSFCDKNMDRMIKCIKELKKTSNTVFTDAKTHEPMTERETNDLFDKIIYLAENSSYEDMIFNKESLEFEECYAIAKKNTDELFDILKDYYWSLWD